MTARNRFRIAAAVGALVAPLALVATTAMPADAGTAKHKHEIYMYKVEKNLRLAGVGTDTVGDSPSTSLSCDPGDTVLDGMWSVKHVDQYNPPPPDPDDDPDFPTTGSLGGAYNDERDVYVKASFPDLAPGFQGRWYFQFQNRAYGDAQVKIFVTCIRGFTEFTNSHRHQIRVTNLPATTAFTNPHAWAGRTYSQWASPCFADQYFVAPGFDLTLAGATDHRLVGTYPTTDNRGWTWEFAASSPANITFYGKCIDRKVVIANGHQHSISMRHMPSSNYSFGHQVPIPQGDPQEAQYSCDQDEPAFHAYKAMVGWFWMGDYWEYNWFLGMEPRPKTRSFYFWNGHATPAQVKIGALCVNSRTSAPLV